MDLSKMALGIEFGSTRIKAVAAKSILYKEWEEWI